MVCKDSCGIVAIPRIPPSLTSSRSCSIDSPHQQGGQEGVECQGEAQHPPQIRCHQKSDGPRWGPRAQRHLAPAELTRQHPSTQSILIGCYSFHLFTVRPSIGCISLVGFCVANPRPIDYKSFPSLPTPLPPSPSLSLSLSLCLFPPLLLHLPPPSATFRHPPQYPINKSDSIPSPFHRYCRIINKR